MKKFLTTALLAGTAFVPMAEAAQVVFTSPAWRNTAYGGGEFAADILGAGGSPDFYTFCLELNEGLEFNKTYNFTTSDAAEAGGISGGSPDPISEGTAYLYDLFSQGVLLNYSFATGNPVANAARAASGRALGARWRGGREGGFGEGDRVGERRAEGGGRRHGVQLLGMSRCGVRARWAVAAATARAWSVRNRWQRPGPRRRVRPPHRYH